MASVNRPTRKAQDADIIRLNSIGISLATIGKELNVHPTSISTRLKQLNIPPANTRRTFMEDVVRSLSNAQQQWLVDQLGPHISIKDYVTNLIVEKHINSMK